MRGALHWAEHKLLFRKRNLDVVFTEESFDAVVDVTLYLRVTAGLSRPHQQTEVERIIPKLKN